MKADVFEKGIDDVTPVIIPISRTISNILKY